MATPLYAAPYSRHTRQPLYTPMPSVPPGFELPCGRAKARPWARARTGEPRTQQPVRVCGRACRVATAWPCRPAAVLFTVAMQQWRVWAPRRPKGLPWVPLCTLVQRTQGVTATTAAELGCRRWQSHARLRWVWAAVCVEVLASNKQGARGGRRAS